MNTLDILALFIALTLGTQLCRFLPTVLPRKWLNYPILLKLNALLPLAILALLVLTSLSFPKENESVRLLLAQVAALAVVVASYRWLKNVLLSVALGIASINLFLFIY